jgi:hypothetical protein
MNWRLERACSLAVIGYDIPKTTVVRVSLIADVLDRLCIGLCLLKQEPIDGLGLVDVKGANRFRLQRSTHPTSIQLRQDKIDLALNAVELKRWQYFTLRASRDGMAAVDHVDMEAVLSGQAHETIDVVIEYPSSALPVSPDEARRRLGSLEGRHRNSVTQGRKDFHAGH